MSDAVDDLDAARVEQIRARAEAATFGPWGWFGTPKFPYLATHTGGRVYVMVPQRSGMQGATIALQRSRVPGEVGFMIDKAARWAVKERPYRDHLDGYREGINHPDAIFIAHARADIPFLLERIEALKAEVERLKRDANVGGLIDGGGVY